VVAAFLGLLLVFIGIADLKDAAEARREEKNHEKSVEKSPQGT
jgi:hypothetical protein